MNYKSVRGSKIGERKTQKESKKKAFISNFRNKHDIDVMFSDGTIACNTTYNKFLSGEVVKPEKKSHSMLGKESKDVEGNRITILNYISDNDIDVIDDFGRIVRHCNLVDFNNETIEMDYKPSVSRKDVLSDKKLASSAAAIRNLTIAEIIGKLDRYGRCYAYRTCGFGKTYIMVNAISRIYKKVLYVTPYKEMTSDSLLIEENIKHISYMKLCSMSEEKIKELDYDLVIFDECHHIGGTNDGKGAAVTFKKIKEMMKFHPETHYLGLTGSSLRSDLIDVETEIFQGRSCFRYDECDAEADGHLVAPKYFVNVVSVEKMMERILGEENRKVEKSGINVTRAELMTALGDDITKLDMKYMSREIRNTFIKEYESGEYMQFIITYPRIWDIDNIVGGVDICSMKEIFQKAFPNHEVRPHEIHSQSGNGRSYINGIKKKEGVIDLIACVNMLTEEYHNDDDLRGIIIARPTKSYPVYEQIISRVSYFADGRKEQKTKVIIDIYDVLHEGFTFNPANKENNGEEALAGNDKAEEIREIIKNYLTEKEEENSFDKLYSRCLEEALIVNPHAVDWDKVDKDAKRGIKKAKETVNNGAKSPFEPAENLKDQVGNKSSDADGLDDLDYSDDTNNAENAKKESVFVTSKEQKTTSGNANKESDLKSRSTESQNDTTFDEYYESLFEKIRFRVEEEEKLNNKKDEEVKNSSRASAKTAKDDEMDNDSDKYDEEFENRMNRFLPIGGNKYIKNPLERLVERTYDDYSRSVREAYRNIWRKKSLQEHVKNIEMLCEKLGVDYEKVEDNALIMAAIKIMTASGDFSKQEILNALRKKSKKVS